MDSKKQMTNYVDVEVDPNPKKDDPEAKHIAELKKKWAIVRKDQATGNIYCSGPIHSV